ncbi:type I-E CRISPR-associated protein Cas5/CasD [Kitasatospora sp. NBC_01287]|uniref:type I-E CRISPR-associated protein Cas5/CasD n=1 Tax=Kitasatospora sp. NBC_01287 TaxID=2903573 RepID=UPI00225540E6|nr:type I-E CRISPR-associated protein Cas5/CasD [Kitasatospora sp. NBC_01287]MCX4744809.1 type I-E CRISPR-associated protein Cas5/CasD [Kitasatospora sp. NBC_01287]
MSVLVLRLAGPLQSWGSAARFARRTTETAPTKSGVLGLLAGAQGRDRDADLSDLAALRFGVRIEQPGTRIVDLQTAHHGDSDRSMPLSQRFYLADAVFLAALEGERSLIAALHAAVRAPVHLPYLGRRSCPPSGPVDVGVRDDAGLREVLEREPWLAAPWYRREHGQKAVLRLTLLIEPGDEGGDGDAHAAAHAGADAVRDQPISFDPRHRRYALRGVHTASVLLPRPHEQSPLPTPTPTPVPTPVPVPDHDPTQLLDGV